MTKLDCNVVNCSYNEENCCKRTDIQIGGTQAKTPSETSCQSFAPRGCGCTNTVHVAEPRKETEVSCKACDCKFNRQEKCSADHIGIAGGHADASKETECASFACNC